ncbi:MAG: polysaccharide pyruvyl transferase family protein [Clostridia bacterium]|nr:polysaccharide pyruvyl transferase family protein [Clostridia bacterium]
MKIGVLTFHKSINNGAVLQCYALTKRLKQELPEAEVEVIDYHMPKTDVGYEVSVSKYLKCKSLKLCIKKFIKLLCDPKMLKRLRERITAFRSVEAYLPLSQKTIYSDSVNELFEYINSTYDVVIAGSDAIWNYVTRGFPNPYFLDNGIGCKKFSYAASCYGMVYENIPDEQKQRIKEILDSYEFLGVRDDEAEKFVRFVECDTPTLHTCDPTVTLDVNDLPVDEGALKAKLRRKGFDFSKETIGIMGNDAMCKMVRKMYGKRYQIVALYNPLKKADINLHDLTPYEWAYVFRFFKLTFTTFFHGTLVSLRNGIPVVCVALQTKYSKTHMPKVEDFLRRIGWEEHYFHTDYETENIDKIKASADALLASDRSEDIIAKMDKEAESFEVFLKLFKEKVEFSGGNGND